jgi:hypothetical protein
MESLSTFSSIMCWAQLASACCKSTVAANNRIPTRQTTLQKKESEYEVQNKKIY